MPEHSLRARAAVAGVGQSEYTKHGRSGRDVYQLAFSAILDACADAGIAAEEIDGFCSFGGEACHPSRLAAALGIRELRHASIQWDGGGGGVCGALAQGASAIVSGQAQCVVVFRSLAQGNGLRFGQALLFPALSGEHAHLAPYGVLSPAQMFTLKVTRFMHEHGIEASALKSIAMTSYRHAQSNPRAVMHGHELTEEIYDASRWIVEPHHLYDCCQETDGAAAIILVAAERARDLAHRPAYLLSAAAGCGYRAGAAVHNTPDFATANFKPIAARLFREAGVGTGDVDVLQSYENFTGGVLLSMIDNGFCKPEEANEFFRMENLLAPDGKLPLNTSGGQLAEAYVHGVGLMVEAVRQIRGVSLNQVKGVDVSMVSGGPLIAPVSGCIFGSEATL